MGLKFKCPNCGKNQQVFDRGLGEYVLCELVVRKLKFLPIRSLQSI